MEINLPTNNNSVHTTTKIPKSDLHSSASEAMKKQSSKDKMRLGSAFKPNENNQANNFCSNTNYSAINYDINNDLNETNFGHSKNRSINSSTLNE